jgi:predicted 2-oxoglutarate/Fe(II)-dependent dioxygenase YbiX
MNDPAGLGAQAPIAPPVALAPGDRVPNFMAADQHGAMRPFYERTLGRPLAFLLGPSPDLLADFSAAMPRFAAADVDVIGLTQGQSGDAAIAGRDLPFPLLGDSTGRILAGLRRAAGLPAQSPALLLLDRNQRLIRALSGAVEPGEALATLALSGPRTRAETASSTAPVLILPNLLDRATCQALVRRWLERGHEEGRIAAVIKGEQTHQTYESLKKRRDHIIRDPAVTRALAETVGRRVAPELGKAFAFTAGFRFENFRVVCYDSERGDYFRRHRDSQGPGTSNRLFAMSLNLNSEDFEGGEVLFPEYGDTRYKPESGGALVFSCALAHEAAPVTAGRRFALLTFLLTADSRPKGPAG